MYHTTGYTKGQITDLCALITARYPSPDARRGRKRALGLFKSVSVTLTYLQRNHAQQELAEFFDVSQATISPTITAYVKILLQVLAEEVPTVEDLDPHIQLIVDGTLLTAWSWADHPELWSGKHRTTGLNVQVACTLSGHLAWVSDPMPDKTHDSTALRASGLLDAPEPEPPQHLGDKGYIGLGMITPIRQPPGGELRLS